MLDVRFLPNPHWVDELRPLPGTDERVRDYVQGQDQYRAFMERLEALLEVVVPGYVAEGKSYLTVAVGCTGGRHRSVVVAEELGRYFAERGIPVTVAHPRPRRRLTGRPARAAFGGCWLGWDPQRPAALCSRRIPMSVKIGINGFGRIGRNFFRAAKQLGLDFDFVAVNDLGDAPTMAHLLKYDSVHGRYPGEVAVGANGLVIDGDELRVLAERNPADLPGRSSAPRS